MSLSDSLVELLQCHSTPGEEDEVAALLLQSWRNARLEVRQHGRYAVSARAATADSRDRPVCLVCAHMDSPGYVVQTVDNACITAVSLGHPSFFDGSAAAVLKTALGKERIQLEAATSGDGDPEYVFAYVDGVAEGDRVCFEAVPEMDDQGLITSPFLDNRLGCAALCELGPKLAALAGPFDVVLGATSCEEMNGFGAHVLARAIEPDLVLCLDATYEACIQNVVLGGGPVLTLTDASVLLGGRVRDCVRELADEAGIPLQMEVYNVSGTDSRAFPLQGLPALVLPLLIATRGNHTPREVAALSDLERLVTAIEVLAGEAGEHLLGLGLG